MTEIEKHEKRFLSAKRHLEEALEEMRFAGQAYLDEIEALEKRRWSQIVEKASGRSRRPKGEIEKIIGDIFRAPRPKPLTFHEIFGAVNQITSPKASESTVRQTLYRLRKKGVLEAYSGRWSPGLNLKHNTKE